jgi:hypothetical protein
MTAAPADNGHGIRPGRSPLNGGRLQRVFWPRSRVVEFFPLRPGQLPETSRLLPGPPSGGRRDEELAGGDAETRTRPADESPPPPDREVWKPR